MSTPTITIFVRHSKGCRYAGDEFARRCDCRKWLRWTPKGEKRERISADTRSWAEAEQKKRDIEDQLSGRAVTQIDTGGGKNLRAAIDLFLADKRVQGITEDPIAKYTRELGRLEEFCEGRGSSPCKGSTGNSSPATARHGRPATHPARRGRSSAPGSVRSFATAMRPDGWRGSRRPRKSGWMRYRRCHWPGASSRILASVDTLITDHERHLRARGLLLLMRWSGLALGDACKLKRSAIQQDKRTGVYRVVTKRQKTGTDVSVPIPPAVAEELLRVPNDTWTASKNGAKLKGHPDYVFWDGRADIVQAMTKSVIGRTFKAAGVERIGNMTSHRIRDTFAVDLLEKGVPMEELSRLLGHTSIRVTEKRYAKWSPGRQDRTDALVMGTWA